MSINPLKLSIRAKKLGVLIRDARLASRKSLEECAQAVGVRASKFEAYELGEESPSLPELEALTYLLKTPIEHFWSSQTVSASRSGIAQPVLEQKIGLRHRIIGGLLRKARQEVGLSLNGVAEKAGLHPELLESYELGETPVPLPTLEVLSGILDRSIRDFQDRYGPVGGFAVQQRGAQAFLSLPQDLQAFISKPVNHPFLELAQRLSDMPAEKLRAIAEDLLAITL